MAEIRDEVVSQGPRLEKKMAYRRDREGDCVADNHAHSYAPRDDTRNEATYCHDSRDRVQRAVDRVLALDGSTSRFANLWSHNGFLNVGCEYAACPGSPGIGPIRRVRRRATDAVPTGYGRPVRRTPRPDPLAARGARREPPARPGPGRPAG